MVSLDMSSPFQQLATITYVVIPFNFLVDTAVVGSVLTPPLLELGAAAGLTPLQIGLSIAVGTGMVFMPYQGAPFMIAYSFGYVTMRQFITTMVLICLVNLILLVPLNLLYWRWIGLF
jgi:di/tricarboxylate transporter